MDDHTAADVVQHLQVRVDEVVVELYLLLVQLVVVRVHLVYELTVEVRQLLQLLPQQGPHILLLTLVILFLALLSGPASEVAVNCVRRVHLQDREGLLTGQAAVLAPAYFAHVGAPPGIILLNAVNDVVLEDEKEAVEAKLLFAGSGLVVAVALVHQLVFDFAHVASSDLHEGNSGAFVEGQLLGLLGSRWLFNGH